MKNGQAVLASTTKGEFLNWVSCCIADENDVGSIDLL